MGQNYNININKYNMIILGIHDGHNASATLIVNGKLACAIGEERLSRDKHQYGFPTKAIQQFWIHLILPLIK